MTLSLGGALLGTVMSFQPMGCTLHMALRQSDQRKDRGIAQVDHDGVLEYFRRRVSRVSDDILYVQGAIVSIVDTYSSSGSSGAWSFTDNSNSA
jgi:hypothetical protein